MKDFDPLAGLEGQERVSSTLPGFVWIKTPENRRTYVLYSERTQMFIGAVALSGCFWDYSVTTKCLYGRGFANLDQAMQAAEIRFQELAVTGLKVELPKLHLVERDNALSAQP